MHRFRKDRLEAPASTGATPHEFAPVTPGLMKTETDLSSSPSTTDVGKDVLVYGKMHAWDPNMDSEKLNTINHAVETHDSDAERAIEHEIEESSPYPEVNAAVPLGDDPSIPANTVRAWILGMFFVTFGSGLNMIFSLRQPSISITSIVAQLCAYPMGVAMARWLPTRKFSFFGIPWTLNSGPFNKKEHCLVTVMANVSFGGGAAYSTLTIEAMRGFVGNSPPPCAMQLTHAVRHELGRRLWYPLHALHPTDRSWACRSFPKMARNTVSHDLASHSPQLRPVSDIA